MNFVLFIKQQKKKKKKKIEPDSVTNFNMPFAVYLGIGCRLF